MRSGKLAVACLCVAAVGMGCKNGNSSPDNGAGTEWVNFHTELPMDAGQFDPLMSGLFGSAARGWRSK